MKRFLVFVPLLVAGCSKPTPSLDGVWESSAISGSTYLQIEQGGKFDYHAGIVHMKGTFDLTGQHLVLKPDGIDNRLEGDITWKENGFTLEGPRFGATPMQFAKMTEDKVAQLHRSTERTLCLTHLKQIAIGSLIYSSDYDDTILSGKWSDQLMPYSKNISLFTCPTLKAEGKTGGYAVNSEVMGKKMKNILEPASTMLFLETSKTGMGIAAKPMEVANPPRHDGANAIAFADSHVKFVKP